VNISEEPYAGNLQVRFCEGNNSSHNNLLGEKYMTTRQKKEKDQNEPQGKLTAIPDFLPPPEQLLPREDTIKITIALDTKTLKFFKQSASKAGLKYQRIIREVLKTYARKYG
jgi:predicted DNA binding CopG/RHH family protein